MNWVLEMSELTAEIEKISPLKPITVEGTFFSDQKGLIARLTATHNRIHSKKSISLSTVSYQSIVYVYETTTKEQIIRQFKKLMKYWTKQPKFQEA